MGKLDSHQGLNIVDAVNMLTTLSDLGDNDLHIKDLKKESLDWENVDLNDESTWLCKSGDKEKEIRVKEMFRVILNYLKDFYEKSSGTLINPHDSSRIHNIMALLGRATKKLEKYTDLFHEVKHDLSLLREWRDLKNFYQYEVKEFGKGKNLKSKVNNLWNKSFALRQTSKKVSKQSNIESVPELKGLEIVKQDTDYELFYLKKENRDLFFHKDIVKEIQQHCKENDFFESAVSDDPLLQVKNWQDKSLQVAAECILKVTNPLMKKFYAGIGTSHRRETVINLNKALMALMLSSNQRNLLRTFAGKSSYQYFRDFLGYLRDTLSGRDFINLCENNKSRKKDTFSNILWELPHHLCYALYTHVGHGEEMHQVMHRLCMSKTLTKDEMNELKGFGKLAEKIGSGHILLERMLKSHPNGPIFKVLDLFLEDRQEIFDPMLQDNVPQALYELNIGSQCISHIRIPSPTQQEFINKSVINDEFRGVLRFLSESDRNEKLLLINFQSRTDWKESARSIALEKLQFRAEFADAFSVITLPKNTDFYHQFAPYQDLDHAILFMDQFEEHIQSESAGFLFPKRIKDKIFPAFLKELLAKIHEAFFNKKARISRKERLDYIEIVYSFLVLKIVEIEKPSLFSFSCKDGIDLSLSMSTQFALLGHILNETKLKSEDYVRMFQMLYTFPLFVRERAILPERFYRMLHTVDHLEKACKKSKIIPMFKDLFNKETLNFSTEFKL